METSFILSTYGLLIIAFIGMLTHFLKKKIKGENVEAIISYFKGHFKTVLLAIIATWVGWLSYVSLLMTGQIADVFAVFAIGYLCDSFFNKYESK
uniref:Holin n=1 Tax=viral metagenome TaxID=1070528 RepID=A0A6H2A361_9ZZZZ